MRVVGATVVFMLCALFAGAQEIPAGRLPETVEPVSYDLAITIVPDQDHFSGTTQIEVKVLKRISTIWLHGKDLSFQKSQIVYADGTALDISPKQVEEGGVVQIDLGKEISPQTVKLRFEYQAPFNRKLESLYRVDVGGNSYAFTQFEAISARQCFPGFDEPRFKTPFDITMTVRSEHAAITNTLPVEEKALPAGMKQIRFQRTEKLPTYLIAFAVGPLDVVDGPQIPASEYRSKPVPLRGVAVKGRGKELDYVLKNSGDFVVLLEKYFGIAYPYPKLDLIAVPDFEWGAMENAGAITFRDSLLLIDEKKSSYGLLKSYAGVVAHEIAHQWFGDLVTMAWWDDIWLNEGLTSWMDNKIVHQWKPEYHADTQAVQSGINIMNMDSTENTHPVHRPVKDSKEIATIADGLIFAKGAAIPLMFENYLGEETFQKVIRQYLNAHKFGAVTSEDLIASIKAVAGEPAALAFRSFVYQAGVPFVEIEQVCNEQKGQVKFRQSRYIPLGSKGDRNVTWQLPLCLRFQAGSEISRECRIVSEQQGEFEISKSCPNWLMPNSGGSGYYRWNLSNEEFEKLSQNGLSKLTVPEQLSMLDSVKSAFSAGSLNTEATLKALAPFASSESPEIATSPFSTLKFVREYLLDSSEIAGFERYASELYIPVYQRLGFDAKNTDSDETKEFRSDIIDFLTQVAKNPEIRKEAAKRGREYAGFQTDQKIHAEAVDPNLAASCLKVAIQQSDAGFMEHLRELLKDTDDATIRRRLLTAIGSTTDPGLLQKALSYTFDSSLRTNEISLISESLMAFPENREMVWSWLQKNYDRLVAKLPLSEAGQTPLFTSVFCTEDRSSEIRNFFSSRVKDLPGGEKSITRAMDYISICSAKKKAQQESAVAFFRNQ